MPYFDADAFVGTALPKVANETSLVDLVFVDFVESIVKSVVYELTGKNYTVETTYGNPNITSSTMWIEFAKNNWAENC